MAVKVLTGSSYLSHIRFVYYALLDLRALLWFEHWQSAHEGLPRGSVGSIGGVEASRIEIVLDGIRPFSCGAAYWSFPAMNVSYYQAKTA